MVFPPLLNRSNYSFLKSSLSIEDIVGFFVKHKFKYSIISDFENAHSWVEFYKQSKKHGLIPIFSVQFNYKNSSVLLIAKNKEGYKNLVKIINNKDLILLKDNPRGLILVHLDGEDIIDYPDKYYANVDSPRGVYVRENKFLNKEDFEFFCLLRAIANGTKVSEEFSFNLSFAGDYLNYDNTFMSEDNFQIKNLYEIFESCEDYDILENFNSLNFFENPEEELTKKVYECFEKLDFGGKNPEEIKKKI